jgi:hypothetical protein
MAQAVSVESAVASTSASQGFSPSDLVTMADA